MRTLVVAYRDLEESYFDGWWKRHHKASTSLQDREGKLSKLYEEIERDLQVGASQEGGRQAGRQLAQWKLTLSTSPSRCQLGTLCCCCSCPGDSPMPSSHPAPVAPSSAERFGGRGMSPSGLFLRTLCQAAKLNTIKRTCMHRERNPQLQWGKLQADSPELDPAWMDDPRSSLSQGRIIS